MKGSAEMSKMDSLTKDEIQEMPMIDIMYEYLTEERQPVDFYTLMDKIGEYKNWSQEEKQNRLVQAYTDMNIDGRFVSLGDNQWGLKSWYPVEQTEEELAKTIKPKKRKKLDDDDFDNFDDDAEDLFDDEDLEAFDDEDLEAFDDESELELIDEEDEVEVIDEEFLDDDYELDDNE